MRRTLAVVLASAGCASSAPASTTTLHGGTPDGPRVTNVRLPEPAPTPTSLASK